MYQSIVAWIKNNWFLILLVILGAVLLFTHLGSRYLWDDEAETALFSRNTLKFGLPKAWDGANYISYSHGNDCNKNFVWILIPWLQCYLVAFSFFLFGLTTFTARLPFVLISLATIILFYFFCLKYTLNKGIARLATLLLVLSPSFILYSRQCRYYALTIFFTVLLLYTYLTLSLKNKKGLAIFILSASLLFHSNYLVFSALFFGLLIAFLVWDFNKDRLKAIAVAIPGIVLLTLPWFLYAKAYTRGGEGIISLLRFRITLQRSWGYFREYNSFSWFPVFFVFFLPLILMRRSRGKIEWDKRFLFLITLIILETFFVSHFKYLGLIADTHYTINLLPIFCLLLGAICIKIRTSFRENLVLSKFRYLKIKNWNQIVFYIILGLLIFTNIFSFPFRFRILPTRSPLIPQVSWNIKTPLLNYLYEITHQLKDPRQAVSEYLLENGDKEDYVLVSPFYEATPLIFYTKMRFCGRLDPKKSETFPYIKDRLPSYIYSSEVIPNWIVLFGFGAQRHLRKDIVEHLRKNNIQYQTIPVNIFYWTSPRPELPWHNFRDVKNLHPKDRVFILHRIVNKK